jgi:hypothetical protein
MAEKEQIVQAVAVYAQVRGEMRRSDIWSKYVVGKSSTEEGAKLFDEAATLVLGTIGVDAIGGRERVALSHPDLNGEIECVFAGMFVALNSSQPENLVELDYGYSAFMKDRGEGRLDNVMTIDSQRFFSLGYALVLANGGKLEAVGEIINANSDTHVLNDANLILEAAGVNLQVRGGSEGGQRWGGIRDFVQPKVIAAKCWERITDKLVKEVAIEVATDVTLFMLERDDAVLKMFAKGMDVEVIIDLLTEAVGEGVSMACATQLDPKKEGISLGTWADDQGDYAGSLGDNGNSDEKLAWFNMAYAVVGNLYGFDLSQCAVIAGDFRDQYLRGGYWASRIERTITRRLYMPETVDALRVYQMLGIIKSITSVGGGSVGVADIARPQSSDDPMRDAIMKWFAMDIAAGLRDNGKGFFTQDHVCIGVMCGWLDFDGLEAAVNEFDPSLREKSKIWINGCRGRLVRPAGV